MVQRDLVSRRHALKYGSLSLVGGLAGCTGSLPSGGSGGSSDFPQETITVVVPFPEGGAADAYARQVWGKAQEKLGVSVKVINEPGAASLKGTGRVMNAKPDGYTLLAFDPPSTPLSAMVYQPDYELSKIQGVASVGNITFMAFANKKYDVKNIKDLVKRYENGDFSKIAGQQKGGVIHVLSLILKKDYPWPWETYVGYAGSPPAVKSVVQDEVPVGIAADGAIMGSEDKVDIVGAFGSQGSAIFPDAPPATEFDFPNVDYIGSLRVSYFAPPETDEERIKVLADAAEWATKQDEVKQWADKTSRALNYGGPDHTETQVKKAYEQIPKKVDLEKIRKLAKQD